MINASILISLLLLKGNDNQRSLHLLVDSDGQNIAELIYNSCES